jgi:DNA-binding MarR family transcriptional regulator
MRSLERSHQEDCQPKVLGRVGGLSSMTVKTKRITAAPKPRTSADARSVISAGTRRILDNFRLEEVASHLLRRAHFVAEELFAQEFAQESITPRQKAALVMLYQNPGISQNALADKLFMDRNTVAEMVKRMAATGLMQRCASPSDQRAYELFLAPDGAALLDRVMPRDVRLEQKVLERLPVEYRPLFVKCMRLIIEQTSDDEVPERPAGTAKAGHRRRASVT